MIRHDAHGMNSDPRKLLLSPGEPLENGGIDFAIRAEEETRLVTARSEQIVLAGGLPSEGATHEMLESKNGAAR